MSFRPNIEKFMFMFSYFEQCCMWAMVIANGSVMKVKLNKRSIKQRHNIIYYQVISGY